MVKSNKFAGASFTADPASPEKMEYVAVDTTIFTKKP